MKKDYSVYIDDMLEAIEKIAEYVADGDEVRFSRDTQQQDAVIRRFSIMTRYPDIYYREFKKAERNGPSDGVFF